MQKIFNLCIISFNELAKANHTKGYKNQQKKRTNWSVYSNQGKEYQNKSLSHSGHGNHFVFLYDFPVSKQVIMETEEK